MKIKLLIILCLTIHYCFSQNIWQKTVGGTGYDFASSGIQTLDGGFALAGWTQSFSVGNEVLYIVKLDANGVFQWSKAIGDTVSTRAYCIIQTYDRGYALTGYTEYLGPNIFDVYVLKLDSLGNYQWSKTIGGTFNNKVSKIHKTHGINRVSGDDRGHCIVQTRDGGYFIVGETTSFGVSEIDFYIIKLDKYGALQWNKTIGGGGSDIANSIAKTNDGGYAIAGYTWSFGAGNSDFYIVKVDSNGTFQWNKTVGGINVEYANSIVQSSDKGYIIAGYTWSFGTMEGDYYIVKLDSNGTLQWNKTLGRTGHDYANSIVQTTDGGYVVGGESELNSGSGKFYMSIMKLSNNGDLQWNSLIGGQGQDVATSVIQTTGGGYALIGSTSSFGTGGLDMFIAKLDANGNTCGNSISPSITTNTGGIVTTPNPTITSPTPLVNIPSLTVNTGGVVTTVCLTGIKPISSDVPKSYSLSQNYPNPFNPTTKIKFSIPLSRGVDAESGRGVLVKLIIFDLLGHKVATLVNEPLKPGTYEVEWDASKYPSGVYFYKLQTESFTETKKMILLK